MNRDANPISDIGCIKLSNIKKGDINRKSFLLNGIYYFDIREFYTPYIGYGIGIAVHEAILDGFDEGEDTTFAYQLKMGVDVEFNRKLSWRLGYRYLATNDPKLGFFDGETALHSIEAGIKFHF
jgi:opacity protein-like surface antigen